MASIVIKGKSVTVDDEFLNLPRDQQDAVVDDIASDMEARGDFDGGQAGSDATMMDRLKEKASAITAETKKPFRDSYIGQGLSGVNEGIANAMSLPATLGNTLLSVGPAVANATLGTDFKNADYLPDPGKPARELMEMSGAIGPESDDAGKKIVRRIGQEVGAALPFGITRPVATLASAVGSGTGAAIAQQVAPDNEYAELGGQLVGGLGAGGIAHKASVASKVAMPSAPTSAEIKEIAQKAYAVASGAEISANATPKLQQALSKVLSDEGLILPNGKLAGSADVKAAMRMVDAFSGHPMSFTQFQRLEEKLQDVVMSKRAGESRIGKLLLNQLDSYFEGLPQSAFSKGVGQDVKAGYFGGKESWAHYKRTSAIEKAIRDAELDKKGFSAGLKDRFRLILKSERKSIGFLPEDLRAMRDFIDGGSLETMMEWLSGFRGLPGAVAGGVTSGPIGAVGIPLAGMGAKAAINSGARSKAATLRAQVAGGRGNTLSIRKAASPEPDVPLAAAIYSNDNEKFRGNTLRRLNALN